jgi:hypothetical protein
MLVRHVNVDSLYRAANTSSVRLYNIRPEGRGFRFQLRTDGTRTWRRRGFSRRPSDGERRWTGGAVCWHGHRAFMRAVYQLEPEAIIATSMARYTSARQFEATHESTGNRMVGSQADPVSFAELCDCPDADSPRRFHAEIYTGGFTSITTPEDTVREMEQELKEARA